MVTALQQYKSYQTCCSFFLLLIKYLSSKWKANDLWEAYTHGTCGSYANLLHSFIIHLAVSQSIFSCTYSQGFRKLKTYCIGGLVITDLDKNKLACTLVSVCDDHFSIVVHPSLITKKVVNARGNFLPTVVIRIPAQIK